jgi:glycosyltransferase involved in cell wall biosynthesis
LLEPIAAEVESHVVVTRYDRHGTKLYAQNVSSDEIINRVHVHRASFPQQLPLYILELCDKYRLRILQVHNLQLIPYALLALPGRQLIVDIHTLKPLPFTQRLLAQWALRRSRAIIVLSECARQYVAHTFGIPNQKIIVIYNGVDLDRFSPRPKDLGLARQLGLDEYIVVGYMGSFYRFQGIYEFLECVCALVQQMDGVKFLMVGDGPEWAMIRQQTFHKGLEQRIVLTGAVSVEQAANYLNLMDIFIIPRPKMLETETAIPLKLLEAMALGKPIVATKVGGMLEVLQDNVNGLVVEPQTAALVNAIQKLINEPTLRKRLGKNARQTSLNFSWDSSAKKLLGLYRSIEAGLA